MGKVRGCVEKICPRCRKQTHRTFNHICFRCYKRIQKETRRCRRLQFKIIIQEEKNKMKQEKVCIEHIPSFFIGDPKYKIVSEKECPWCIHDKKVKNE